MKDSYLSIYKRRDEYKQNLYIHIGIDMHFL